MDLSERIKAMGGPDGWRKRRAEMTFLSAAKELQADGWSDDGIIEFLSGLQAAAAEEFEFGA